MLLQNEKLVWDLLLEYSIRNTETATVPYWGMLYDSTIIRFLFSKLSIEYGDKKITLPAIFAYLSETLLDIAQRLSQKMFAVRITKFSLFRPLPMMSSPTKHAVRVRIIMTFEPLRYGWLKFWLFLQKCTVIDTYS